MTNIARLPVQPQQPQQPQELLYQPDENSVRQLRHLEYSANAAI